MAATKECLVCGTKLTRTNWSRKEMGDSELCRNCFEYAGWENLHNDQGHELLTCKCPKVRPIGDPTHTKRCPMSDPSVIDCPVCKQELVEAPTENPTRKGNISHTRTSHAGCAHESTKAARAACRRARKTAEAKDVAKVIKERANGAAPAKSIKAPKATPIKKVTRSRRTRKDHADAGSIAYD